MEGSPTFFPTPEEVRLTTSNFLRYASYSVLTFQVYEWLSNLPFEISHIWSSPSLVKSQYLYGRYMGLIAQIAQGFATEGIYLQHSPTSWNICFYWHCFRVISGQTLVLSYEIVTIWSLYIIYGQDKSVLAFLAALVSVENLFAYITHCFYLWNVEVFGQCQVHDVPLFLNVIPLLHIITHGILWYMAWRKNHLRRVTILSLITREGLKGLSVLVVMEAIIMSHGFMSNFEVIAKDVPNALFPPVILVTSSAICRTIQNMQTTSKDEDDDSMGSVIGLETVGGHREEHAYSPLPSNDPTPDQYHVTLTSETAPSET